jgi:hypothetical protein
MSGVVLKVFSPKIVEYLKGINKKPRGWSAPVAENRTREGVNDQQAHSK